MSVENILFERCRICGKFQEEDEQFISLYNDEENMPTHSGTLYEELMDMPILAVNVPEQTLCANCDDQLNIFKRLKEKAQTTFDELKYANYVELQVLNEESAYLEDDTITTNENKKSTIKKGYECYCCQAHFNKRDEYRQHRLEAHQNKYPCTEHQCNKVLKTPDALRVHLKCHKEPPKYKCTMCDRVFYQKVHLKYHLNKHYDVRKFNCQICRKAFLSKADLNTHMRSHNERRHSCQKCDKKFLTQQHLNMHYYSHQPKSFECPECHGMFVSPITLKTHQQVVHGMSAQRFECEFCGKKFRSKNNWQSHYQVHNKNMWNVLTDEEAIQLQTEQN